MANQFLPVSEQFPKHANFLTGDITGRNNIKFKQIRNPGGVFVIGFLSFDSPDILGVSNDNVTGILQDIKNWNPVFTSGFEADLSAIERKKPFFQRIKIGIGGGCNLTYRIQKETN